jgi:hypothetical protein
MGLSTLIQKVARHKAVQECTPGEAGGSDYLIEVWLKEGFKFRSGRMAGCRTGFFNTYQEFRWALED